MKVRVLVGDEVIHDSSKNKIAKVIEPEKVENKIKVSVNIPKESIFNKTESKNEEVEDIPMEEEIVEDTITEEEVSEEAVEDDISETIEEPKTMNEELDEFLESESEDYDEDDYDYDEDDYIEYASNRERQDMRKAQKQNKRSYDEF